MIYTTYFAKLKKLPDNVIPISICGKAPGWYGGLQYKKLAPKYDFFIKWKDPESPQYHDNEYYTECFQEQVLGEKSVSDTVAELFDLLNEDQKRLINLCNCPPWENRDLHIALVCYDKTCDFCHRHLVADWFSSHGIQVEEWDG